MGLLILERKELASEFDQMKASVEASEMTHKCDQAVHSSAVAEARKREESLKKALGIEKECIASVCLSVVVFLPLESLICISLARFFVFVFPVVGASFSNACAVIVLILLLLVSALSLLVYIFAACKFVYLYIDT